MTRPAIIGSNSFVEPIFENSSWLNYYQVAEKEMERRNQVVKNARCQSRIKYPVNIWLSCENKYNAFKIYFGKKAPSTIFDSVLNMLLVVEKYFNFREIIFH